MPFAKRSGAVSQIDQKLQTKRQKVIEEDRIRILRESLLLFYDKLMEKYQLIHPLDEEIENNNQDDEFEGRDLKLVSKDEIVAFTSEYADTKPIGF